MPTPHSGESREEFLDRCIPMMVDEGREQDQAVAMCSQMWRDKDKSMNIVHKVHSNTGTGVDFVLSDETVDRMGDVIRASGWDLTNFKKNPIALFNHKSDFPIGMWHHLRVENRALRGNLEFAPLGTSERIDELRRLSDAGILRAVSVGFHERESRPLKDGNGIEFMRQELVETSLVAVPANPNALAVAKSLGVSEETRAIVFAKPIKEQKIVDAYINYCDLRTLDEWTPYDARKAKRWLDGLRKMYPTNSFYRKLYRLFDEIETVRTVSEVLAKTGRKN